MSSEIDDWLERMHRWLHSQSGHEGHDILAMSIYANHQVYGESAGKTFVSCSCGERLEYKEE